MGNRVPAAAGLAAGGRIYYAIGLGSSPERPISTFIIPEYSCLETARCNNFEPAVIKVVIDVDNTVQCINHDVKRHSVRADNELDFYSVTHDIFHV